MPLLRRIHVVLRLSLCFIKHTTKRGERLAVEVPTIEVPTVEVFNSMIMPDGTKSVSFGRIIEVIHANPSAPADWMLQKLTGGQ